MFVFFEKILKENKSRHNLTHVKFKHEKNLKEESMP